MGKLKAFEKPIGFQDMLPEQAYMKRVIENRLQCFFDQWGYKEMLTPTIEYDATVGRASKIPSTKTFKLLDKLGNTLVLRPDMTAPIARVVSSFLQDDNLPVRISYHSNVFRAQENEAGKVAEFYQSGIELVGEGAPDADAEVLTIACESLKLLDVGTFRLTVNHVGFLYGILDEWVSAEEKHELIELLSNKNLVGYKDYVKKKVQSEKGRNLLLEIIDGQGGIEKIEERLEKTNSDLAKSAAMKLISLWQILKIYKVDEYISFDLSLIPNLEYYTGMVFEGTVENTSFPVCNGGRYDSLLHAFNNNKEAVGFALKINRILEIANLKEWETRRLMIFYDDNHREEALIYALKLREESEITVETHFVRENEKIIFENKNGTEMVWFGKGSNNE